MSIQGLTLPQRQKLKELTKKFGYMLASEKEALKDLDLSDQEKLETLIVVELSQIMTAGVTEYMNECTDKGYISIERMLPLLFEIHAIYLKETFHIAKDLNPDSSNDMLLTLYTILHSISGDKNDKDGT